MSHEWEEWVRELRASRRRWRAVLLGFALGAFVVLPALVVAALAVWAWCDPFRH